MMADNIVMFQKPSTLWLSMGTFFKDPDEEDVVYIQIFAWAGNWF